MGTTAQKLNRVLQTKSDLKTVINYSGANITNETTFKDYPKLLNKAYIDILNDAGESLYNALPKTTGTGTSIDLNTEKGKMKIELNSSDLTQSGTPTPDNPLDIHVVTGVQNIQIIGKNLIEPKLPTTTKNGITITNNGDGSWTLNGTATSNVDFRIDQSTPTGRDNLKTYNGTYTFSCNELINGMQLVIMQINTWNTIAKMMNNNIPVTFTTDKDNCFIYVFVSSGTTLNNLTIYPQLEKGTIATPFKPYYSQNYPVNLGNIELCKIGDYQDYIYNQNGDWYLHKEIGKVILNGGSNESYAYQNNHRFWLRRSYWTNETVPKNPPNISTKIGLFCNRFVERAAGETWSRLEGISYDSPNTTDQPIGSTFTIACNSVATTESNFKTWLSNNPLEVVYILQNTQDIQITDTTLIQQLDNLKNAKSYEDKTYIIITNDNEENLLLEVEATALKSINLIESEGE